jgi:hypothetical protein
MALFLVLAIGADDIFVFMDAYKQSASKGPEVLKNLSTRMTWVYKRAGLAMLITSATTCAAFLCTCTSPLASQISFGVFAALVIFCGECIHTLLFICTLVIFSATPSPFPRPPSLTPPHPLLLALLLLYQHVSRVLPCLHLLSFSLAFTSSRATQTMHL